jgi:hypothetical protein
LPWVRLYRGKRQRRDIALEEPGKRLAALVQAGDERAASAAPAYRTAWLGAPSPA